MQLALPRAFLLPLLLCACRTTSPVPDAGPSSSPTSGKLGILAPLEPSALALWPEAHSGSWVVLEVLPHGSTVEAGQVVARCETRSIDDELRRAELELHSAEVAHAGLLERGRLESEGARAALARAQAGLERTRRSLEAWKEKELVFAERSDALARRYEEAGVEDQVDELDRLEKMYEADELVDATEDIVLKRSRRGLAITKDQNALARDRAALRKELELVLQTEQREEEYRAQAESVARLERQQVVEAAARADGEARSAAALAQQGERLERLRRDRSRFELVAPCAGVLLHGASEDYRPGKTPARHERGSTLAPHTELFLVAALAPAGVAFDVSEAELATFRDDSRVDVRALAGDARSGGAVRLDEHPRSLGLGERSYEAFAALDSPLAGARYGERVRVAAVGKP